MIFQLDQCANSKMLIESCTGEEQKVEVRRLPNRLVGSKDPDLLREVLPTGQTLVTTDRTIHTEHWQHFPSTHAGVVIVATNSTVRTLTTRRVMSILAAFKRNFPSWHKVSLGNSVVEITEGGVEVWRAAEGRLDRVRYLDFQTADWRTALAQILERNAQRGSIGRE